MRHRVHLDGGWRGLGPGGWLRLRPLRLHRVALLLDVQPQEVSRLEDLATRVVSMTAAAMARRNAALMSFLAPSGSAVPDGVKQWCP